MADVPPSSSPDSHYEQYKITLDSQENVASSPPRPSSTSGTILSGQKIKKPPTVTPKRFSKFFAPRNTASSRGGRQSKAGRQLRDITKNGANRRRSGLSVGDDFLQSVPDDLPSTRAIKRRKITTEFDSSPPQSSPLRHIQSAANQDLVSLSPTISEADTLPDLFADLKPLPKPIRRLRRPGPSGQILERSFGGYDALSRGRRGAYHVSDVGAATANFVSTPNDVHTFQGASLPFCTTSCNTNSLVAVGDEQGSVHLIDSSASSQFSTPYVHFRVHHNAVMDIAFSSDDYVLATASGDQTARAIDMQSQQTVCILNGHKNSVKQVCFRPNDDNMITTSARDGTVQFWDLRCGGKSAVQNFRASYAQRVDSDRQTEPENRYSQRLDVGHGHRSLHRPFEGHEHRTELSITSFQHLPDGREHLIMTASEVDASIKLWDIRNAGRRNPVPLSSTPAPETHRGTRNYGINALALSGDGSRLYAVCRDANIYAYSTNQMVLGYAPEMSSASSRRRMLKEPQKGLAPLYGFKHPLLRIGSFYIKASLRPAKDGNGEVLAVGSTDRCPILFPTDERYLPRRMHEVDDDEEEDDDESNLPTLSSRSPNCKVSERSSNSPPIYEHGSALVRGHNKEVTSLTWTAEGNLISVSDDFTTRCWREDAGKARELRQEGEEVGGRWQSGWADVGDSWDEDDC